MLGYENTCAVTMDDMIHHCRAVRRGAPNSFILGDMPFGSYESGPEEALHNAFRFMKEGMVDAIKLEGAGGNRVATVQKLVESGIPVCGHIGLTPQGVNILGGFRAQGKTAAQARSILTQSLALQEAGAFAVLMECVPSAVARAVTDSLRVPTIGIGAGAHTTGQVLVYHDVLGLISKQEGKMTAPGFCKQYANLTPLIQSSLRQFRTEVLDGSFPSNEFDVYKMTDVELAKFESGLDIHKRGDQNEQAGNAKSSDDDVIPLY